MRFSKNGQPQLRNMNLGMAFDLATIPTEATWISALNYCQQINNDSLLLSLNNNDREFEFVVDLLFKTNFPNISPIIPQSLTKQSTTNNKMFNQEQKYFIGLTHNSK